MRVPEGPFKIRLESNKHLQGEGQPAIRAGVCFLQLQTTKVSISLQFTLLSLLHSTDLQNQQCNFSNHLFLSFSCYSES